MLGENHSLAHEFPEHLDKISELSKTDESFSSSASHYNALDKEIRVLELRGNPIDDQTMNQMKLERAELKDLLHQRIIRAK
ncbi:YdcH family protein [Vibrio sp. AK197]